MIDDAMGYHEDPKNGDGFIRARTTKQIRSWEIPRSMKSLDVLNKEWGETEFPGLYILLDTKKNKVYVGEAKDLITRLNTHTTSPEEKIKDWDKAIIINDGRPATQSDFNDNVIRLSLELYLINLFKTNKYTVVSQGEQQKHNAFQHILVESFKEEILFFLKKKTIIIKDVEKTVEQEIFPDELKTIIEKSGKTIQEWREKESIIDGEKAYIRQGSKKPKGWQITIRGRKSGSFIESFNKGEGHLVVRRGGVLYIPLSEVKKVVPNKEFIIQDTVDVYVVFNEDKATLKYKDKSIDVTKYRLIR